MWFTFVKAFLRTLCIALAVVAGFIVLVDPYDAGRFGAAWSTGVADSNPRTSTASRGRDRRFDAAVIGNSRGQLIDPVRLSMANRGQFVQLTIPGSGPREQLTVLNWFALNHSRISAIVVVVDHTWCTQDASLPIEHPFPFWLYSDSDFEYALHALQNGAIRRGWSRILIALGWRQRNDPTGYDDYEREQWPVFAPTIPQGVQRANERHDPRRPFPAIDRLKDFLDKRAAGVATVIVYPPVFVTELPPAGSAEGERIGECKGALAALARSRTGFLDLAIDGEVARNPANFMDSIHYRAGVARGIESRIIAALTQQ